MRNLKNWKWYLLALACMAYAFYTSYTPTWQYLVGAALYLLAGGLVWSHVATPKPPTRTEIERIRMDELKRMTYTYIPGKKVTIRPKEDTHDDKPHR